METFWIHLEKETIYSHFFSHNVMQTRPHPIQSWDLDRLQSWTIKSCMKFNESKCWVVHLGWGSPGYTCKLGHESLKSSTTERKLKIWVDGKLTNKWLMKRANPMLGLIQHSIHHWLVEGGDCTPLLCTNLTSTLMPLCRLGCPVYEGCEVIGEHLKEGNQHAEMQNL